MRVTLFVTPGRWALGRLTHSLWREAFALRDAAEYPEG